MPDSEDELRPSRRVQALTHIENTNYFGDDRKFPNASDRSSVCSSQAEDEAKILRIKASLLEDSEGESFKQTPTRDLVRTAVDSPRGLKRKTVGLMLASFASPDTPRQRLSFSSPQQKARRLSTSLKRL